VVAPHSVTAVTSLARLVPWRELAALWFQARP
jgi:hypothetical protein